MDQAAYRNRRSDWIELRKAAEAELARGELCLAFGETLRPLHEADLATSRVQELTSAALSGIVTFVGLALLFSCLVIPAPSWIDVALLCTVTPLLVAGIAAIAFRAGRSPWLREGGAFAISCCFTVATLLAVGAGPPAAAIPNLFLVSIPVVAAIFFARLRFGYALAFVAVTAICLAGVLLLRADLPASTRAYPIGFLLAVSLPALAGVQRLERAARKVYLHGLLQSLQIEQLAFENSLLNRLSTTDAVTGAANRRQLETVLGLLCAEPACGDFLLLADIDFFKRFNDRHGHLAGDACLREVVDAMRSQLSATDLVTRFGGEEFAIVLSRTTRQQALATAERVRAGIAAHDILVNGRPERVTASIGVAERLEGACPATLVALADGALYEAKRGGRNRVKCAWQRMLVAQQ